MAAGYVNDKGRNSTWLAVSDQPCPYRSRSFFLRTLPTGLRGSSSINSTPLGLLKLAMRSRQNSITSSGVAVSPRFNTTKAKGAAELGVCG